MAIFRYSGNWRSYLEGSSSTVGQNIAGNSSVIKVDVWIGMDAGWSIEFGNTYGNSVTVNCDGQSQTIPVGPLYLNGSKKYLGSVQFTVGHKPEGDKTAGISISSNMSNISYGSLSFGNASGSWSHVLPPIPRSSSISFSTGTIGSTLAITINRASSSFTHTLRWAWGNRSGTIASGLTTSASWTIPMDFCNELPNNISGTGTIYVDTYSDSTKIGTQSQTFTANVPSSVIPTFTGITLDDQNAIAKELITGNTFIQIISSIKVTFNGAAGTYGSTIKGFRAEVLDRNLVVTTNGGTFEPMNFNGTATIRASVTDSRGRVSDTKDLEITLLEYYAPGVSIQVLRTRENPNTLQVLRTIKVAPLTFNGVHKNSTKLVFEAAELGSTSFVADNGSAGGEWNTIFTLTNSEANLAGTYYSTSSWTVRAKLSDKFTSSNPTIASTNVGTEKVINAYDKDGRFGVGKIPELGPAGSLDVAGDIYAGGKQIQQHQITKKNGQAFLYDSGFDLNAALLSQQISCNNPANGPTVSSGPNEFYVEVIAESDNYLTQHAVQKNSGIIFVRTRHGGTWSPWKEYATKNGQAFCYDSGFDLNAALLSQQISCNNPANGPTVSSGPNEFYVEVIAESDNYLTQHAVQKNSGRIFVRTRHGGTWSPWKEYATTDHPMLQEKPLRTVTQGMPYGLNATLTRKDNLVTVTLNRRITNIDVFEYHEMIETIPIGYRPTAEVHMVIVPNAMIYSKVTSILHFATDGKIRFTNGTSGNHVWTGTVTYITNDLYP